MAYASIMLESYKLLRYEQENVFWVVSIYWLIFQETLKFSKIQNILCLVS